MIQPNKIVFLNQGIRMTQQQAQQKISKIDQLNAANNQLLATIKLGLGFTQSKFPDKLSSDLHDIYSTCMMYQSSLHKSQSNLIQEVKRLTQSLNQQQYRFNTQKQQKSYQLEKERKKNSQLQKKIREVTSNNTKLYQYENLNMKLKNQIFTQKNQYQKLKYLIQSYQRQINKYKLEIQKLSKAKQAEVKKTNWSKTIQKFQSFEPITFKNSQHEKQMLKTKDWLKNIDQQRQSKRQKQLQKQNEKLTEWLKQFIDSVSRILHIRLKKLRQSVTSQQEIKQIYRYLPKMHLKTIFNFENPQFPYTELLFDFEKIMQQAQEIKYQNQQYQQLDKTQIMNKQLVQMVISEIRKCKGQILNQFKMCGQKREEIAEYYETLMEYDNHVLELVSNITLDKLRKFQQHPNRLINEINHEIQDLRKHQQFIESNFSPSQPHFLTRRIQANQHFYQQLNYIKDEQKKNQFKTSYISELQRQDEIQRRQRQDQLQNLSYEQRKQIERKQLYKEAKQFVVRAFNQRSVEQYVEQVQNRIQSKDLNELKRSYFSQFRHQNVQQQRSETEEKVEQNKGVEQQNHHRMQEKPSFNFSNTNNYNSNMKGPFNNNQQSNSKNIFNSNPNPYSINKNQNSNENKKNQPQSAFGGYSQHKQWEI